QNKTPLVNESLKKFLNTKDGRLVASLVAEFLQFFNLDFTLAVFQPETSTFQSLEGRENLARDLGIVEAEGTVGGPLLLEVIRRCQQKGRGPAGVEGALDLSDAHSPPKSPEERTSPHTAPSKIPRYKGQGKKKTSGQKSGAKVTCMRAEGRAARGADRGRAGHLRALSSYYLGPCGADRGRAGRLWALSSRCGGEPDLSRSRLGWNQSAVSPCPHFSFLSFLVRASEPSKQGGSLASLSDAPSFKSGLSALPGAPSSKDSESKRANTVLKDLKLVNDKIGSLGLGTGEDDDYADDFNSTSHRSEKSELSIGEDIEEDLSVGLDDANTSDKLDDLTQDLTVSQLSDVADYLEDVAFT
ncbi:FGFR1 oncogene partner, partial [Pteropus alecto]